MASRPKNMDSKAEQRPKVARPASSTASLMELKRANAVQLMRQCPRLVGPSKSPHANQRTFSPVLPKPLVQPASSPPAKQVSAAPSVLVKPPAVVATTGVPVAALKTVQPTKAAPHRDAGVAGARPMAPGPVQALVKPAPSPTIPNAVLIPRATAQSASEQSRPAWKKLLLAALPGFFGVLGLSQLYQGKKLLGTTFLVSGAFLGFLSSWYIILPSRIDALLLKGQFLSPYALSFLSSTGVSAALGSKLAVDLLGLLMVVWGVQLFDAVGSIFTSSQAIAVSGATSRQGLPVRTPALPIARVPLRAVATATAVARPQAVRTVTASPVAPTNAAQKVAPPMVLLNNRPRSPAK